MTVAPPRPAEIRKADTLRRLSTDVDAWVSTAADAGPHLVPLSFLFDGVDLWLSTAAASRTVRNLSAEPRVRLGLGPTRDLVLIEGTAAIVAMAEVPAAVGEGFGPKTGFDPRPLPGYVFIRVTPDRVMAWREENELADRLLMKDGDWSV